MTQFLCSIGRFVVSFWNLLWGFGEGSVRGLRFLDEDDEGNVMPVEGSKWYVRHYKSFRRRTRNLGKVCFFATFMFMAMGGYFLWGFFYIGHGSPDPVSFWVGLMMCVSSLVFVPMGVLVLRLARDPTEVAYRRFWWSVRFAELLPVVLSVTVWLCHGRSKSIFLVPCMLSFLPGVVSSAVRGFLTVRDDPADGSNAVAAPAVSVDSAAVDGGSVVGDGGVAPVSVGVGVPAVGSGVASGPAPVPGSVGPAPVAGSAGSGPSGLLRR